MEKKIILTKQLILQKIERLAYEIIENNNNASKIILAGIKVNGALLSKMLYKYLKTICNIPIEIITIEIDKLTPKNITIAPNQNFDNTIIIIVDDVSMTGKTMMYATLPFLKYYPTKIQTLVLVERQQKNFPINSDYVGMHISTTLEDRIIVDQKNDEFTEAYLQ